MNARIPILATACGIAALAVVIGFATWPTAPERVGGVAQGNFAARFQPVLEGIGSTRDLTPVPLGEAEQASPSAGGKTARSDRHGPHSRRR
jgi:hypothetical protein